MLGSAGPKLADVKLELSAHVLKNRYEKSL
jgi:hypothetical protein